MNAIACLFGAPQPPLNGFAEHSAQLPTRELLSWCDATAVGLAGQRCGQSAAAIIHGTRPADGARHVGRHGGVGGIAEGRGGKAGEGHEQCKNPDGGFHL